MCQATKPLRPRRICLAPRAPVRSCQGSDLALFQAETDRDQNFDLEGALFGVFEGQAAAKKPQGRGSGKAELARVLGRLRREPDPQDKDVRSHGVHQRCPDPLP